MLTAQQKERLQIQQFRIVGRHSAVKICSWTKNHIRKNKVCYKQEFYDIHTGNCLEMTPAITCNQRCLHCWRDTSVFAPKWEGEADEPKEIIQGCIEGRKELLVGFGGSEALKKSVEGLKRLKVCELPDHAAISLTGEPTLYPKLPQLIDSFFDDFNFRSVFLVTNGTQPEMLKKIGDATKGSKHFPTNLYLSMESYSPETYQKFNNPVVKGTWEAVQESMKYLATIKAQTRTILRITAVKGFNMDQAKEFVQFVELMKPVHIEIKGYAFMGHSRNRLKEENVPNWEEVQQFAQELGELCEYKITGEHQPSTIVQLSKE